MAAIKPTKPGTATPPTGDTPPATSRTTHGMSVNENATTRTTRQIPTNENATTRTTRGLCNENAATRTTR